MLTRVEGLGLTQTVLLVFLLGMTAMGVTSAGDLEQRFLATEKRAQAGDIQAMYAVGEAYELGMGTISSHSQALKWYRAAAEKGHPEGAYQMGYAYYWGKGVAKDRKKAFQWFLRAAEKGSQAAMPYLSKMYALGQGVPQDKAKAAEWSERASIASHMNTPPPAPQVPAAPAQPAPKPAPAPETKIGKAAPAPGSAPAKAEAKPQPKPKPKPKPRAKPKPKPKPRPTAKRTAKKPPARIIIEQLLASYWSKDGHPVLYLPSAQTTCVDRGKQLSCASEPRRSSLLGRAYAFRFVSTIENFTAKGGFSISYQPQITGVMLAGPGAYGEESDTTLSDEQLRARVEREPEQVHCELQDDKTLRCKNGRGEVEVLQGVSKGQVTALNTLPSGIVRTHVAIPPSPPPRQEAPEESRRSHTIGHRP
jgi:hypothetical protein